MAIAERKRRPKTANSGSHRDPRMAWLSERRLSGRRIRNLQITSMVLFVACLALTGLVAWTATRSRVVPYIVEVDRLGQAVAFAPAERLERIDDRFVTYQLSVWIHHLRTVTSDTAIQRRYLEHAYALTRDDAAVFVERYFDEANPFERARREQIEPRIQSILPVGEDLWQIQWTETVSALQGARMKETRWQAVVAVELDPPRDTSTLLQNPLGLYVTDLSWTETL